MKIESHDWSAQQVFSQGYFVIPRFQRPYSWDREQVEEFWEDAISEKPEQYFIGSMVFFKQSGDLAVVDGQQRLTTIVTALCALRDEMQLEKLTDAANGIHNVIERKDIENKLRFCLRTESSYPYFQECILKRAPQKKIVAAREEEKRLKLAYDYFIERIQQEVASVRATATIKKEEMPKAIEEQLKKVRDRLLGLNVIFVLVDNEDDAYIIFETLNTRGKDLRTADLVKTHFTRMLRPENSDLDPVKDRWGKTIGVLQGSEASINPDMFLLHWWLSREDYTTQKKLYKKFQKLVTRAMADKVLEDMSADAVRYRAIWETAFRKWSKEHASIRRSLDSLRLLRVEQPLPMVFSLIRELDGGGLPAKAVAESLRHIENFHFLASSIASFKSSGGTSMMYASHARGLFRAPDRHKKQKEVSALKDKLRDRMPSLEETKAGFANVVYSKRVTAQKKLVQYLLEETDLLLTPARPPDFSRMTIEHLAPQAGHGIEEEDVAAIGNLILVPAAINSELGTKTFPNKKALLKKHHVPLDPIMEMADKWGAAEIKQRTTWLAEQAHGKIWVIK